METTSKATEALNDLIEINNDRIAGFNKASKDLKEGGFELTGIFDRFADESRRFVMELTNAVNQHGGEPETGRSASGAIHRAWIDVKATFGGSDRKSILQECERGEDAIKKAYQSALEPDNELSVEEIDLVRNQQYAINAAHDQIKALRDSQ
ncbi:MAG: aldehyde dehydrogenase [Mucilaginibacter sp.]|nr:aldehyde dehydrogenase [Mucilaginibacter sp.]